MKVYTWGFSPQLYINHTLFAFIIKYSNFKYTIRLALRVGCRELFLGSGSIVVGRFPPSCDFSTRCDKI